MKTNVHVILGLLTIVLLTAAAWIILPRLRETGSPASPATTAESAGAQDTTVQPNRQHRSEAAPKNPPPSDSEHATDDLASTQTDFYGQVHVLCVGIDHFPRGTIEPRRFLEKDANDLAALLRDQFGYRVRTLTGSEAKKTNIEEAIQRLGAVGPNDAVILFFATHGKDLSYVDDAGDPVQAGYLLPWDAPLDMSDTSKPEDWQEHAISFAWLGKQLESSNARHVLLLLNTCHSGYIGLNQADMPRENLEVSVANPSRAAITAGLSGQEAREPKPGERVTDTLDGSILKNSHFTHYLLQALSTNDAVGASELHAYLNKGLRGLTGNSRQYAMWPQYRESTGSNGEFVFIPRSLDRLALDEAVQRFNDRRLERWRSRILPPETMRILYTPDPAYAVDRDKQQLAWRQRTQIYKENASLGDAEAMAALSHCYRFGLGVKKDPDAAFEWATNAYEHRSGSSVYALALCYQNGIGVQPQPILADRLMREAAKLEYPAAIYEESWSIYELLADHTDNTSVEYQTHERRRIELLRQSAESGFGRACHELAMAYLHGEGGLVPNREAVEQWANSALHAGDPMGHLALADLHTGVNGLAEADPDNVRKHLLASAEAGFPQAQYFVGMMMVNRDFVGPEGMKSPFPYDPPQGVKWLQLAADQKDDRACFVLGTVYADRRIFRPDYTRAKAYMDKAVEADNPDAVFTLFKWYLNGHVVIKDIPKSLQLLHEAADLGHGTAQYVLGGYYTEGIHVNPDPILGLRYLSLACEQEVMPAIGIVCETIYDVDPPWSQLRDRFPDAYKRIEDKVLNQHELLVKFLDSSHQSSGRGLQNRLAFDLIRQQAKRNPDLILSVIMPKIIEDSLLKPGYIQVLADLDNGSGQIIKQLRDAQNLQPTQAWRDAIAETISAITSARQPQ